MKPLLSFLSVICLLILSGCASVQMAPMDADAKAKDFIPQRDKAALFIYRNENFGAAIPMAVSVNGKSIGQTAAMTYFRLNVLPGKYKVESHAENISSLELTAESGKNYFVWQEVKMGLWMARSLLQQVDEVTGRAGVAESKLVAVTGGDIEIMPLDVSLQGNASDPVAKKLRDLQGLRKDGLISEDEYQKKRQELLQKL